MKKNVVPNCFLLSFILKVSGVVENTGRRVVFTLNKSSGNVIIYGGPLNYRYLLQEIEVKFGDDDSHGSEHAVNGRAFPIELKAMLLFLCCSIL